VATNIKIGKRTVDELRPREKPFIAFDQAVAGFGVRVVPNGTKTFVLEYRPGAGGRAVAKKRLVLGRLGAMTADQARDAALDALARIRLGNDPQAEKARQRTSLTVSALIDDYRAGHVVKLKAGTREAYGACLAKVRAAFGPIRAEALSRAQVATLHNSLSATPYAGNRMLSAVRGMFAWAEDHGHVPEGHANPASKKIARYREEGRERYLTGEELARLGDALREAEAVGVDPYAIAALRLLALTGARLREILHAKWSQLDLERGLLFLADSKTGKKPIYLSAGAQSVLAALPRVAGNPFIIPGMKAGAPRSDLKKPWAAVTRAAELDGLRIHDLRHSFASVGAGASLGLPVIGRLLGHATPATTQKYAHLADDPLRRAVETIGATIDGAMNRKAGGTVVKMK
jgi:integrase